jgi:hypothetical protein
MLIVMVLLATVVLRVALVAFAVYLLLPRGPRCRACGADMLRLQNAFLVRCLPALERRWCLTCGWNGVVRRTAAAQPAAALPQVPAPPTWE